MVIFSAQRVEDSAQNLYSQNWDRQVLPLTDDMNRRMYLNTHFYVGGMLFLDKTSFFLMKTILLFRLNPNPPRKRLLKFELNYFMHKDMLCERKYHLTCESVWNTRVLCCVLFHKEA